MSDPEDDQFPNVTLSLSRSELLGLIEAIYAATWVSGSGEADPLKRSAVQARIYRLEQKVFPHATKVGLENFVDRDDYLDEWVPTAALEESSEIAGVLREYDDHVFWEELISRLAEVEMARRYTNSQWSAIPAKERGALQGEAEERIREQLMEVGIEGVFVRSRRPSE